MRVIIPENGKNVNVFMNLTTSTLTKSGRSGLASPDARGEDERGGGIGSPVGQDSRNEAGERQAPSHPPHQVPEQRPGKRQ